MLAIELHGTETLGALRFVTPVIRTPTQGWGNTRKLRGETVQHQALDFPVSVGTPVHAAAPGRVMISRDHNPTAGNWIVIEHDGAWTGFMTRYLHLSKRLIAEGAQVEGGQIIGKSGNTGMSTGPHLHFDMGAKGATLARIRPLLGNRIGRPVLGYYLVPSELFLDYTGREAMAARAIAALWRPWSVMFL